MEFIEVKHDFDSDIGLQCCLCLSVNRNMKPLGDLVNIYNTIIEGISSPNNLHNMEVCWECRSLLRRILILQKQVLKAQELLQNGQSFIYGPLSNLVSVTLNDDKQIIYFNENYTKNLNDKNVKEKSDNVMNYDKSTANVDNENRNINDMNKINIGTENLQQDKSIISTQYKPKIDTEINNFEQDYMNNDIFEKEISKTKSKNKWAQNRVEHNKKPKFKLCLIDDDYLKKCHLAAKTENYIKCSICDEKILSEEYKRHYKNEHKLVLECLKCGLKFSNRRKFYAHYKAWHEKFICDHCGVSFKMRYSIKNHISKQHAPSKCTTCNKSFATHSGLWRHNKLTHTRPTSPAYCVECDKVYNDVYTYRRHLCNSVQHVPRKKLVIPCTGCEKTFTKKIYMTEHYNLVHLKLFKNRCEQCDKNFIRNADLVKHRRKVHEGILPPKNKICNICGRGFATNRILGNHQKTHNRQLDTKIVKNK